MENPFGTAGNKPQEEATSTELPLDVWFVARTSDRGGARPKTIDTRDGLPFLFKTGLYCVGGDGKAVAQKMRGGYTFFQAYLRPLFEDKNGERRDCETQEDFDSLGGRMTGFMNACLSPGISDAEARWANTMKALVEYANELKNEADPDKKLTPDMFKVEGTDVTDNAAYMVAVFGLLLENSPRLIIVNQKIDKGRNKDRNDVVVKSFKDAIVKNAKTKDGKVIEMFPDREGTVFEFYMDHEESKEDATEF